MGEHTPTPWNLGVDGIGDIFDAENMSVAKTDSWNVGTRRTPKTNRANAAFIVDACNNHDRMRSALQLVRKYMQEDVDHFGVQLLTPENRAIWDAVNGALGESADAS
jgi:hypothetical protein